MRLVGIALCGERLPGRHDEHVAAAHMPLVVAHGDRAFAVKDLKHCGADLALGLGAGAAGHAVHFAANGGQHIAAIGGVAVAHGGVAGADRGGIAFGFQRQLLAQGAIGIYPAIGQQRGGRAFLYMGDGAQTGVGPQPLRA